VRGGDVVNRQCLQVSLLASVHDLEIRCAVIAYIDPVDFLSLRIKIAKPFVILSAAEGTANPVKTPDVAAERTEGPAFPLLSDKSSHGGKCTANRAVSPLPAIEQGLTSKGNGYSKEDG
jgi:hypothetical protein